MKEQDDINKKIEELSSEIFDKSAKDAEATINKIDRIRADINDILVEYANKDGTIPEHRIRTLTNELNDIESGIGDTFFESIDKSITETSKKAEKIIIGALITTLGASLVFGGKGGRPNSGKIVKEISEYVFNRNVNGVKLSNRINSVTGILRDEIQRAIRQGINLRESITGISRRVKKAFEKTSWQIKRVFTTELPIALRTGIATIGGRTGIVKAVKIIDNRGRHKNHENHECYRLAEQDKYGMGKGIYKPQDTFIFDPHPQCSAYFQYIVDPEKIGGGNDAG